MSKTRKNARKKRAMKARLARVEQMLRTEPDPYRGEYIPVRHLVTVNKALNRWNRKWKKSPPESAVEVARKAYELVRCEHIDAFFEEEWR